MIKRQLFLLLLTFDPPGTSRFQFGNASKIASANVPAARPSIARLAATVSAQH